jgi:TorA maturation chaperone TorD
MPEWDDDYLQADMYQLLAVFLRLPDQALARGLLEGSVAADLSGIFADLALPAAEGTALLAEFAAVRGAAEGDLLSELRQEYTRLFTHPHCQAIPIYETLFLHDREKDGGNPLLFISPAALDAERCYKSAGLTRSGCSNEPADHMATELEFMMYLYCLRARGREAGDAAAQARAERGLREFAELHLQKWGQAFFECCAAVSAHPFYRAIGRVGSFFLRHALPGTMREATL